MKKSISVSSEEKKSSVANDGEKKAAEKVATKISYLDQMRAFAKPVSSTSVTVILADIQAQTRK